MTNADFPGSSFSFAGVVSYGIRDPKHADGFLDHGTDRFLSNAFARTRTGPDHSEPVLNPCGVYCLLYTTPASSSTARTRGGVIGTSRMRTPVASKNAFAIAAG